MNDTKTREFLIYINNLLAYLLQYIQEDKNQCFKITTENSDQLLIDLTGKEQINILYYATEQLIKTDSLESPHFIEHLNLMSNVSIEFLFPSDYYKQAYISIIKLKRASKTCIEMHIFMSGIEKVDVTFRSDKNINSVVMDESIKEIESGFFLGGAFYGCTSLKKIVISPSVKEIGENVFYGCKALKEITIPPSVTVLHHNSFEDCSSLEKISIPSSVVEIGSGVLSFCYSLKSLIIPPSVTTIGIAAFEANRSLTTITIPSSVRIICSNAFSECSGLKEVIFECPSSLNEIADEVFMKCSSLKKITIPSSVVKIGPNVFYFILLPIT